MPNRGHGGPSSEPINPLQDSTGIGQSVSQTHLRDRLHLSSWSEAIPPVEITDAYDKNRRALIGKRVIRIFGDRGSSGLVALQKRPRSSSRHCAAPGSSLARSPSPAAGDPTHPRRWPGRTSEVGALLVEHNEPNVLPVMAHGTDRRFQEPIAALARKLRSTQSPPENDHVRGRMDAVGAGLIHSMRDMVPCGAQSNFH